MAPLLKKEEMEANEGGSEAVYPFEHYSYEMEMYNQLYAFQHSQMLYYQQLMAMPAPTADTASREARLLEERRKRRKE
jgi:hypothetical protein